MAHVVIDNKREKKYQELNMTEEKLRQGSFIKKKESTIEPDKIEPKKEDINFEWDLDKETIEASVLPEKLSVGCMVEAPLEPVTKEDVFSMPTTEITFLKEGETLFEVPEISEERMEKAKGQLMEQVQTQVESAVLSPEKPKEDKPKKRSGLRRLLGI